MAVDQDELRHDHLRLRQVGGREPGQQRRSLRPRYAECFGKRECAWLLKLAPSLLDPEAYDTFADLFYPVIAEYHKVDITKLKSVHDLGDASKLEDLSTEYAEQIVSTRVRVGRTVKGYPMAGKLTRDVSFSFFLARDLCEI